MFDEQPDGDPHGECALEIEQLRTLLSWAYGKLAPFSFRKQEDALRMDEIKLKLME